VTRPDGAWPTATTTLVGVMGDPVAHSLSPLLHNTAFAALGLDWASVGFTIRPGEVTGALKAIAALGFAGMSVTMPHKAEVAAGVDERTTVAERLGAVNCVIVRSGRLIGENTDGAGFLASLRRGAGFEPTGRRCLVIGAGGAARAVTLALAEAGAHEVVVVNRNPQRAEAAAALGGSGGRVGSPGEAAGMDLVVNATPAGMAGTPEAALTPAVDPATLGSGQVVADLIYHPARTVWLTAAAEAGASVVGGLGMLVHQAEAQLEAWTGLEPPVAVLWAAAQSAVADRS
jgi:shikimate dehydrogenase